MATIFFSYSHKDEALRDQLESHLAMLKNQGLIDAWHDRRIIVGDEVDDAIFSKLETADIILLLVSADFISSTYCYSREMKRAMERHHAGEARVIPVILRHCLWHQAPFGKLLAAPRDGKPVTAWPDRDEALADVAQHVAKAIEALGADVAPARDASKPSTATSESGDRSGVVQPELRSSNLRLKKEFTEKDRDDFLRSTFEFLCKFFDGSVDAIGKRNPDVTGSFERIDSRRLAAILYRNGRKISECSVRLGALAQRTNAITFSYDASANQGSFNEMLTIEASEQSLYLKPMGMALTGRVHDKHLSQEGAAEYLWELFINNAR